MPVPTPVAAALAALLLTVAACSGPVAGTAAPTPTRLDVTITTTTTTRPTDIPSAVEPPPAASRATTPVEGSLTGAADCVLSLAEVSDRLAGNWTVTVFPEDLLCLYENDRGASIGAIVIPVEARFLERELRIARNACSGPPDNVGGNPAAFLCRETLPDTGVEQVSGSVIAYGRLWLLQIEAADDHETRAAQFETMRALLTASLAHQ